MAFLANLKMKKAQIIPHFLEEYRTQKLRVGFSGGADSTALLLLLQQWGFTADQLEAVHFDHGLRGSASTADGEWCHDFCSKRNIKFVLVKLDLSKTLANGGSLEDAARNARINWYRENDDQSCIVLAHHAGDVQENMLLKLARGGNVSALTSLRKVKKLWDLTILRPLLDWHKNELEDFLRQYGINDWRNDATNQESDYHRNFLRNKVLPQWANFHAPLVSGLDCAAKVLARDADFIEQAAAGKLAELGKVLPLKTQTDFWLDMHEALSGRVLRSYLAKLSGRNETTLTFQNVENFRQVLQKPESCESKIFQLNKDFSFRITGKTLELLQVSSNQKPLPPQEWYWRQTAEISYASWQISGELLPGAVSEDQRGVFYFDADLLPEKLCCTMRQGGETMHVWGNSEPRRIKHLLSGIENKENMLLLTDENSVIYILGNLRRSIYAPVTGQTQKTLKITVSRH